ncbi:hypothetical protein [Eisenbergiella tayi]|uniref:hypothetical protein n=1 Tax=Eisenbergiella tayi TaxID=1432052 RepID=UPI0008495643|nr:hypothetical protein [Eisenbergiella tayi]ODR35511.1 hypothetical protein BEI60_16415 [Eisenbergiella tayi]
MAEILKDVFEDDKGNKYYLANNTEITYDQAGIPLNNGGDLSEASVNFSVGTARKALTPKARFKSLMGDIAKWLTDLGTAAFCNVANNDTTTVSGFVADARIVKQHGDEIDGINSDLNGYKFDMDEKGNALAQYYFDGKIKTVNLGGGSMTFYGLYGQMNSTGVSNTISIPVTLGEEYTIVIWIDTYAGTESVLSSMTGATVLSTLSERNFNNSLNKSWVHIKRIKATSDIITITGTMGSSYSNVVWAALFSA